MNMMVHSSTLLKHLMFCMDATRGAGLEAHLFEDQVGVPRSKGFSIVQQA